ncbi:MAG: Maf family protein [Oleiphilaceae bacterium]|nr:Maf family protein [Oleiphilaceae bacterium]
MALLLASASPRRCDLLRQIGLDFTQVPVNLDETPRRGEAPGDYVQRMAREKATLARSGAGQSLVLAADTSVILDQRILGKPESDEEAVATLRALSGRSHQVLTSVALAGPGEALAECLVRTDVHFCVLEEAQIRAYVHTGEHRDKAGSYAIQGRGALFVQRINGSYSAVVGLPLQETAQLLASAGQPVWRHWESPHE